jgi:hypothetical protein
MTKSFNVRLTMALAVIGFGIQQADAAAITILNAGFESASLSLLGQPDGPFSQILAGSTMFTPGGTLNNWTAASSSTVAAAGGLAPNSSGFNWTVAWWGGGNIAYLQAGAVGTTVSLSQTLTDVLLNNSTYTFSAFIGNRKFSNLADYHLDLLAGSAMLASVGNNVAGTNDTSGTDSLVYNSGTSNALAGQALTVRLRTVGLSGSTTGVPTEAFFDNVTLGVVTGSSTAPEPVTWPLIAAGLVVMGCAKRRV